MSHTSVLKSIRINSIDALEEAVEFLRGEGINVELVKNAVPRMYYENQHGKCDYVLRVKDSPYDVGFDKQEDGSYAPVFDSWNGHLQKYIGMPSSCPIPETEEEQQAAAISRLLDCYAIHAAKEQLQDGTSYYEYSVSYDANDGSYCLEAEEQS